jgi:hypothetical protein
MGDDGSLRGSAGRGSEAAGSSSGREACDVAAGRAAAAGGGAAGARCSVEVGSEASSLESAVCSLESWSKSTLQLVSHLMPRIQGVAVRATPRHASQCQSSEHCARVCGARFDLGIDPSSQEQLATINSPLPLPLHVPLQSTPCSPPLPLPLPAPVDCPPPPFPFLHRRPPLHRPAAHGATSPPPPVYTRSPALYYTIP